MSNTNYLKILSIFAGIITSTQGFSLILAQPPQVESSPKYLVSLEFPAAPNTEPPQSTIGGGRRGKKCVSGNKPLIALMPNRDNQAKTFSSQPTFLFYIPQTAAESAQFVIIDEQEKEVEIKEITLNDTPGIVKVSLSPGNTLEAGKKYLWGLTLICNPLKINKKTHITGEIERINLDTKSLSTLATAQSPLAKAKIYARQGLWPETLMIAADLRTSQPEEWNQLLQSVGLQDFSQEPFLN